MKKILFTLLSLLAIIMAKAEPADPTPVTVTQPGGETIQLVLVGDEFYSFNTTVDGYTVLNVGGEWQYAAKQGTTLAASGIRAHDPAMRTAQEAQFLAVTAKMLMDEGKLSNGRQARARRDAKNAAPAKAPVVDYSKFRGLVVLINFNDKKFSMGSPNSFYNQMCNTRNYTGFTHQGTQQTCTGSVRDYFYDQSMGQFDPQFDVVGPVNLNYSCKEGNEKSREIFQAALDAVDSQVDFSKYDSDSDGNIDMVFFLVAGYASSYSGNDSGYLWPHMSYLYGYDGSNYYYLEYDGKRMGRYASSCEIYGWEAYGYTMPMAIGTICHEFGHVLGLPDLYDTDYAGSGGTSNHPGDWDVMASGSKYNYGRTPVGYSLWERMELGFTTDVQELTEGAKTLQPLHSANNGFYMNSDDENEFFLFENRQAGKWDFALPSHGLVITRVDYTNPTVWNRNTINCDPSHNYYELVRASGTAAAGVPFPGTNNVTEINSITSPALLTWAGDACRLGLENITESGTTITFNAVPDVEPMTIVETFEKIATTTSGTDTDLLGDIATWGMLKANITENSSYDDAKGVAMQMPGGFQMESDIDAKIFRVSAHFINSTNTATKVNLFYSTDEGATWNTIGSETVAANADAEYSWRFAHEGPVRFKITRSSGSKTVPLLVDNFTIHYTATPEAYLSVAGHFVSGVDLGNIARKISRTTGQIQYLPLSNTLRMKDATIDVFITGQGIRSFTDNLKITVEGENKITSNLETTGILLEGTEATTITAIGDAKLTISVPNGKAIWVYNRSYDQLLSIGDNNGNLTLQATGKDYVISGLMYMRSNIPSWTGHLDVNGSGTKIIVDQTSTDRLTCLGNLKNVTLNDGLQFLEPVGATYSTRDYRMVAGNNSTGTTYTRVVIGKAGGLSGDVNQDSSVNAADVTALYNYILNGDATFLATSDVNGDGSVNAGDVTAVYNIILGL